MERCVIILLRIFRTIVFHIETHKKEHKAMFKKNEFTFPRQNHKYINSIVPLRYVWLSAYLDNQLNHETHSLPAHRATSNFDVAVVVVALCGFRD